MSQAVRFRRRAGRAEGYVYMWCVRAMNTSNRWSPCEVLLGGGESTAHGVVVLNRPITFRGEFAALVVRLWNSAKVRTTVDGGTDSFRAWAKDPNLAAGKMADPDLITGDMDSILPTTLKHYESSPSTSVIHTEDQNETDFTKALRETGKFCANNSIDLEEIYVLSEISGRFDQLISNINTLYKSRGIIGSCKVYILCVDSLTWLLEEGEHKIEVPRGIKVRKEPCGLLPFGAPCRVTTRGLKWNLDNHVMEFGKLVSTSNTYSEDPEVHVKTNNPIIWTMGIEGFLDRRE